MPNEYYAIFLKTLSAKKSEDVSPILGTTLLSIEERLGYLKDHLSLKELKICRKLMELQVF